MPAYYDDNTKTWYLKINIGQKQKKKRGFKTKKEAVTWERDYISQHNSDMSMPFQLFVNAYFEDKSSRLKQRTKQNKKYMIDRHIKPYFENKAMNDITSRDIMDWQNKILEADMADTYRRMLQNQVSALFNHAVKYYDLNPNPCQKTERIGKSNAVGIEFWTLDEYKQFISTIDPVDKYYSLYEILFWTGMRSGEALALTYSDIDFTSNTISITKTYYRTNKKDYITSPKTSGSVREVSIPQFLSKEINDYTKRLYDLSPHERLYPVVAEALQQKFKRDIAKSNNKKIRVHDLRHSHVAMLINMDIQPLAIASRVGHDSVNTTLNIYGHLYPNTQKNICERLEKMK